MVFFWAHSLPTVVSHATVCLLRATIKCIRSCTSTSETLDTRSSKHLRGITSAVILLTKASLDLYRFECFSTHIIPAPWEMTPAAVSDIFEIVVCMATRMNKQIPSGLLCLSAVRPGLVHWYSTNPVGLIFVLHHGDNCKRPDLYRDISSLYCKNMPSGPVSLWRFQQIFNLKHVAHSKLYLCSIITNLYIRRCQAVHL